jgi:hypothetical protein
MSKQTLWYTRRGKEIRGPFPVKQITRYILLGRISESDYLSTDQRKWTLVSDLPEFIPEEMQADLSVAENREKLRLAKLREDERKAGDRRQTAQEQFDNDLRYRRSGDERREGEPIEVLRHREIKTETARIISKKPASYRLHFLALLAIIALIISVAIVTTPEQELAINNCNEPPRVAVNWSNCRMDGIHLSAVDLARANLKNTTLVGADLSGANLNEARMSYVNLLQAKIENGNLSNATMIGAVLRKTDLRNAKLRNSDLSYAILHEADLSNADLSNANLTHAVLNGANLTNTNLTGAVLDKAVWVDNRVCAPGSVGKCLPLNNRR